MRDWLLGAPKGHTPVMQAGSFNRPLHAIISDVAAAHGLTYGHLTGRRGNKQTTHARFEAYWRCSKETTASLPQIGKMFGNRDHSTVMHGIRRHEERMRTNVSA